MRKYFSLLGLSLLTVLFSFTACSDDDDNKAPDSKPEEVKPDDKHSEQATALLTILDALAEVDSLPDNWNSPDFTAAATYGKALDAANPHVRSAAVSGLEEAIAVFNNLTDEDNDTWTQTKTWTCEGVGSLTYTLKNQSDCTATIDVNVPKLRGLSQIRLVPAEALGENGSFKGQPYYTVGDVVKDADDHYWICARGAYSKAGKEDTHWFSFMLKKENVIELDSPMRLPANLPTKLGCETEKMRYLFQFLKFVADPTAYRDEDGQLDATCYPKGVGNLGSEYLSWEQMNQIAKNWTKKDNRGETLISKCFISVWSEPYDHDFMYDFKPTEELHVYYKDHSKSLFSDTYKMYCKSYIGKECTEHNDNVSWSASSTRTFDIKDYVRERRTDHSGHERGYVVRYKSGKELNGKKSVKATEAISTVEEIYRYNANK